MPPTRGPIINVLFGPRPFAWRAWGWLDQEARDSEEFLRLLKLLERVAEVRQEEEPQAPPSRRWSPSTAQIRALKQMREDLEREAGGDLSA